MAAQGALTPNGINGSRSMRMQLPRPQYPAVPEAFISALAWRTLKATPKQSRGAKGYVYKISTAVSKGVVSTYPDDNHLRELGAALNALGVVTIAPDPHELLGDAVANSVLGTLPLKSKSQPASPLTYATALAQDVGGLMGTPSPPDLGKILETLYALGRGYPETSDLASSRWADAVEKRLRHDKMLCALDAAISQLLYTEPIELREQSAPEVWEFAQFLGETPFSWMYRNWRRLTCDVWVRALPPRVWVDWATTILRMGLGLGYLWEAGWYESLSAHILSTEAPDWMRVRSGVQPPMFWQPSSLSPSMRDVGKAIRRKINRGYAIQLAVNSWFTAEDRGSMSFQESALRMRDDADFRAELVGASMLSGEVAKNAREAVTYSLSAREGDADYADYYGLLRRQGNFLTPNPGTEWIAVVASLACEEPGRSCDVADVMAELGELGVRPELRDLINLLERAGLARGSADADQGVIVKSAF